MSRFFILITALALPWMAQAQVVNPVNGPTQADLESLAAQIPQPASSVPPAEMIGGTPGTAPTFRRADAAAPRITRAATATTVLGGTFSVTWADPLPVPPTIVLTPIAASASIDCQLTAPPTTTSVQGRCWTAQTTSLNLSIITAGLTLNPMANTVAGVAVQVIALPPTQ